MKNTNYMIVNTADRKGPGSVGAPLFAVRMAAEAGNRLRGVLST